MHYYNPTPTKHLTTLLNAIEHALENQTSTDKLVITIPFSPSSDSKSYFEIADAKNINEDLRKYFIKHPTLDGLTFGYQGNRFINPVFQITCNNNCEDIEKLFLACGVEQLNNKSAFTLTDGENRVKEYVGKLRKKMEELKRPSTPDQIQQMEIENPTDKKVGISPIRPASPANSPSVTTPKTLSIKVYQDFLEATIDAYTPFITFQSLFRLLGFDYKTSPKERIDTLIKKLTSKPSQTPHLNFSMIPSLKDDLLKKARETLTTSITPAEKISSLKEIIGNYKNNYLKTFTIAVSSLTKDEWNILKTYLESSSNNKTETEVKLNLSTDYKINVGENLNRPIFAHVNRAIEQIHNQIISDISGEKQLVEQLNANIKAFRTLCHTIETSILQSSLKDTSPKQPNSTPYNRKGDQWRYGSNREKQFSNHSASPYNGHSPSSLGMDPHNRRERDQPSFSGYHNNTGGYGKANTIKPHRSNPYPRNDQRDNSSRSSWGETYPRRYSETGQNQGGYRSNSRDNGSPYHRY